MPINTVHVIHLEKRVDRELVFKKEFREQGIHYRVWPGIICTKHDTHLKNSAEGINLAHKQIVRYAKENNLPYVIIAEDDIIFTHKSSWKYFVSKIPDPNEFDLFFSMIYSGEIRDGKILNGISGLTMYVVSSTFYDFFLSIPDEVHIDRWLGRFAFEKRYFVIDKFICKQTGGFTDNLNRELYYDAYLLDRPMYNGE